MTSKAEQRIVDGSAWRDFCRSLERAGEVLLRAETPATPFDRAEGIRYLTRLLRAGLESQIEYGDPAYPGFFQLSNETIKIGNDNPDNIYWNCNVSGSHEYRITGTRGTVPYLSFGTKGGGYEQDGTMVPTGALDSRDLAIEPDGSFEIAVSCEKRPGNWLPMRPETSALIVRMSFHDRAAEEPARIRIERLGRSGAPVLDPETLEAKLQRAASFVQGTASLFVDWMNVFSKHANQLPADDQERCMRAGGDRQIFYYQSRWRLAPDEGLFVRVPYVPICATWNFQVSNFWLESLDYRYLKVHVNKHTAHYEPDGSVRILLTHRDPGPRWQNWLTTAGHDQGSMLLRFVEAKEHPPIETRVVKAADFGSL